MKSLRSKFFLFICLLLIFPAIPLSVIILQLLDRSYHIGVNNRVESALDGALYISADFYQMQRNTLQNWLDQVEYLSGDSEAALKSALHEINPDAEVRIQYRDGLTNGLIGRSVIRKFISGNNANVIWPDTEHTRFYALACLKNDRIVEISYPLPESFQSAAKSIQEVSQIYKTLGFVQSDIRRSFLYTFLSVYLAGVMLALAISYSFSKRITKPVDQLVAAADEIGKGRLDVQVAVKGRDELSRLGSAFNRMVVDLAENQKRMIELEKMASWQQLARRLAHEIKNPLTPIQLMAQQMRDKYDGSDANYKKLLADCSAIIEDEVDSLQRLVREFSDFARLPEFRLVRQDLLPLMESIRMLYSQFGLKITVPDYPLEAEYDFDYMKRVMINLVDNAIAAAGEPIEIRLGTAPGEDAANYIQIEIKDCGEGIAPENLDKIFEPYFSTKRTGVGLGLAIVRKIIHEHKGEISVRSSVGEGTTFSIRFPVTSS